MFQISYAVFVLVVGGITGIAFAGSKKTRAVLRMQLVLVGLSLLILLGFFAQFGFFWGVVTIVELSVGIFVGFHLASDKRGPSVSGSPRESPRQLPAASLGSIVEPSSPPSRTNLGWLSVVGWLTAFAAIVAGTFIFTSWTIRSRSGDASAIATIEAPSVGSESKPPEAIEFSSSDSSVGDQRFEIEPMYLSASVRVGVRQARYRARPFATAETPIVGTAGLGTLLAITGRSIQSDGLWYQVDLGDGRTAYIRADLTVIDVPVTPSVETLNLDDGVF